MPAPSRSAFSPGTARGLAAAVGIPADLAVTGGEPAMHAMMELKRARDAGGSNLRGHHLVQAQQHIAGLDPARHGTLMQHLQAHVVAMGGRGGDTRIAHVTPGEVVVPESLLTPDVVAILRRAAKEKGLDPSRFVVGSGRNVINPNTGQMEFDDGEDDSDVPDDGGQTGSSYDWSGDGGVTPGYQVSDASNSSATPNPNATTTCVGTARILKGNPNLIGRTRGFSTPVPANSAAVTPSQWGGSYPDLRQYGPSVTGTLNGAPLFQGIGDVIGNDKIANVRQKFQKENPGQLILELPSGPRDLGNQTVDLHVPYPLRCPTGTR